MQHNDLLTARSLFLRPITKGRTIHTDTGTYQTISSLCIETIFAFTWSNPIDFRFGIVVGKKRACSHVFRASGVQVLRIGRQQLDPGPIVSTSTVARASYSIVVHRP